MNLHSQRLNWNSIAAAIGSVLLVLVTCPKSAAGQTTNTFPSSGNAGIGIMTPLEKLHVYGGASGTAPSTAPNQVAIENSADAGLSILNPDNKIGRIMFGNPSGSDGPNSGLIRWDYTNRNFDFATDQTGGYIRFLTGAFSERVRIDTNGNTGIGTTSPGVLLDLKGNNVDYGGQLRLQATDYDQISFYNSNNPTLNSTNRLGSLFYSISDSTFNIDNYAGNKYLLLNPSGGNVGVGTSTPPTAALEVHGDIKASGNISAKYQDVAEWVPASAQLPAGTVVVLDSTKSNQVISSAQSYDTRVAGVVSEKPGIALGESGDGKVLVSTTGRVLVKVDATNSPIHIGDLLVTSDIPGVAMKSEPIKMGGRLMHMPGTLIGKALEPLEKGSGKILVLLSLQ